MKVLLLGKAGQLGWELHRTLQPLGKIVALNYPEIDMTDPAGLQKTIRLYSPDIVVNATAYTAVDKAESEPELARKVNAVAPGILAEETQRLNALLVHFSTDYVFDGEKGKPYIETDTPKPLNMYGESKLSGEQAIQSVGGAYIILRTAWVYGTRRDSFLGKVLQWARQNETLNIVSDQVSNPTWARMLAQLTALLIARAGTDHVAYFQEKRGIYHLAGNGYASRFEWAQHILNNDTQRSEQIVRALQPAATRDFPSPAQRPLFSALDCKLFGDTFGLYLPDWQESLQLAMS